MKNFSLLHHEFTLCCILKICFTLCLIHYSHSTYAAWHVLYCRVYVYSNSSLECKRKKKIQRMVNLCKWEAKKNGGKRHQYREKRCQDRRDVKAGGYWRKTRLKRSCLSRTRAERHPCKCRCTKEDTGWLCLQGICRRWRSPCQRSEDRNMEAQKKSNHSTLSQISVPQCLTQGTEAQKWGREVSREKLDCLP